MQYTLCNVTTHFHELEQGKQSKNCKKLMDTFEEEVGSDFEMDDFLMPTCDESSTRERVSGKITLLIPHQLSIAKSLSFIY